MSRAHSPSFQSLHLRHSSFSNPSLTLPTSQLILQPFRCFTYVTAHSSTLLSLVLRMSRAHSPSFPSLQLRHSSFSNPSFACPTYEQSSFSKLPVASATSQIILQPFPRFTYVTALSPALPLLHLRHSSFSNPSFASPTSQDFHLCHLASRQCFLLQKFRVYKAYKLENSLLRVKSKKKKKTS